MDEVGRAAPRDFRERSDRGLVLSVSWIQQAEGFSEQLPGEFDEMGLATSDPSRAEKEPIDTPFAQARRANSSSPPCSTQPAFV